MSTPAPHFSLLTLMMQVSEEGMGSAHSWSCHGLHALLSHVGEQPQVGVMLHDSSIGI